MTYEFNPSPINYLPYSPANNHPLPSIIPIPKPVYLSGNAERNVIPKTDDFTQAGERYRSLNKTEKAHLCDNNAVKLWKCKPNIIKRVMQHFENADKDFVAGVMHDMEMYRKMG